MFLKAPAVRVALMTTVTVMLAAFLVVPNISTYIQQNMHYPRTELSILYFAGGGMSFLCMQIAGRYVDRLGAARISLWGTVLFCAVLLVTFVIEWSRMPVVALFIVFMSAMAIRNVSMGTLSSRVPEPHERARFMSIQSAVQHLSSATGAFVSSLVLRARPDHSLEGMPKVAGAAIVLAIALPVLLAKCERLVRARDEELAAVEL
jgi:predicted MFS family arabinose efflux permease